MSFNYHESKLWKQTLGKEDGPHKDDIDKLRNEYESIHENVKFLANGISSIFPEYTLHDISHIDELWDAADIILNQSKIELNPAEGFVLGCSFLFHDLGMSSITYDDRETLENDVIWKDSFAHYLKKNIEEVEAKKKADLEVLRQRHPENAQKMPFRAFVKDSNQFYVIKDDELREGYGEIIGKIAYSHGISINEFDSIFSAKKFGARGFVPGEWPIDVIKLAGILRIADAIHIYSNRAPLILMASKKLSDYSKQHWTFHSKMSKPIAENHRLEFTSTSFSVDERESWWLCYDVLKMINQELLAVDSLFNNNGIDPLGVFCVKNIDSPESLSKSIKTDGWLPIDSKIRVSNVSGLINSLGGKALYGNTSIIPLRELIQNASDAIQAKCKLGEMEESEGRIDIRFDSDEKGCFIEVEDNGIGMSQKVLTGPFLDFGSSFWGTELMRKEIPSLESTDFCSTGRFGIGFFSVFMWGEKVSVTTLRSGDRYADTRILEFCSGANSRPLLRNANELERRKKSGTKIKIWVNDLESIKKSIINHRWTSTEKNCSLPYKENFINITFEDQIYNLCCGLNCNLFFNEKKILEASEWKKLSNIDFIKKYCKKCHWLPQKLDINTYAIEIAKRVTFLKDNKGKCIGRGLLDPFLKGHLVAGGLKVTNTYGFAGIIFGNCSVATRTSGMPNISEEDFAKWVSEQVDLLNADKSWEKDDLYMEVPGYICEFKIDTKGLSIAHNQGKRIAYSDVFNVIKQKKLTEINIVNIEEFLYKKRTKKGSFKFHENVFICRLGTRAIIPNDYDEFFPKEYDYDGPASLIIKAFINCWGKENVEITCSDDEHEIKKVVGKIDSKSLTMTCEFILKYKSEDC